MEAIAERGTMDKRPGRPKTSTRVDTVVKIDKTLAGKAKLIAAHEGISIADLMSELLQSPIDKRYAKMLRDLEGKP